MSNESKGAGQRQEHDKPKNVLADPKKIEFWASVLQGMTAIWGLMTVGAIIGVAVGIADKEFILVPLFSFLTTFFAALPTGLAARSKASLRDLHERVSELEKRLPKSES